MTEDLRTLPFEERAKMFKGLFQAAGLAVGGDEGQLIQRWGGEVSRFSAPGFTPTAEQVDNRDRVFTQLEHAIATNKQAKEAALTVVKAGMGLGMNLL